MIHVISLASAVGFPNMVGYYRPPSFRVTSITHRFYLCFSRRNEKGKGKKKGKKEKKRRRRRRRRKRRRRRRK